MERVGYSAAKEIDEEVVEDVKESEIRNEALGKHCSSDFCRVPRRRRR
jgi:hypothetical protein